MPGYQPRHDTDPVWFDGTQVNSLAVSSAQTGVRITALHGWDDRPDVRDVRELRAGQDGEYADNLYLGGRTITVEGEVYGSSWSDLQVRKRALAALFQPSSSEVLLKVPDPGAVAWEEVFSSAVLERAPTAWWRFNDLASPPSSNGYDAAVLARADTVALWDSSGANLVTGGAYPGTVNGNPVVVDGPLIGAANGGGALDLDGTGDFVNHAYNAALNPASFTVGAWIYRDTDPGTTEWIVNSITGTTGYAIGLNSSDKVFIAIGTGAATATAVTGATSIPLGQWTYVEATITTGAQVLRVNGVQDGSGSQTYAQNTTQALRVGANIAGTSTFHGKIARPRLHNAILTTAEGADLFTLGRPVVDAMGNHNGGMIGAPTSATGAITADTDAAFDFNGSTDAVVVPYDAALNAATFSITARIKRDSDTGAIETICDSRTTNLTTAGYAFTVTAADKLALTLADGSATVTAGATSLAVDTWYHVAATFGSGTVTLYVNGVSDGTGSDAMTANTTMPLRIGESAAGTLRFPGKIDELTYHGGVALTAAQIRDEYQRSIYDYTTYTETGMYSYERTNARVVEAIQFGDTLDPACQVFQVILRASDPRVYSDLEVSTDSGTSGTGARTATVDQDGSYETPPTITVTGPTGSDFTVSEPSSGLTLTMSGLTLEASELVDVDIQQRIVTLTGGYARVRTTGSLPPVGLWMLDEAAGTTADNEQGDAARDGTYTGGFTLNQAGPFVGIPSVALNGSTGYISIPNVAALYPATTAVFEGWVKFDAVSGTQTVLDGITSNRGFRVTLNSSGMVVVRVGDGVTTSTMTALGTALSAGTWYRIYARANDFGVGFISVRDTSDVELQGRSGTFAVNYEAATAGGYRFGATLAGADFMDGNAAAFAIYSGVIDPILEYPSGATVTTSAYTYLQASSSRWANLGTASSTYTLSSTGLNTGSKLNVTHRDARL